MTAFQWVVIGGLVTIIGILALIDARIAKIVQLLGEQRESR